MPTGIISGSNTDRRAQPTGAGDSTPTFERVLSVFENDTGDAPFDPAHTLVLTRLQRAAGEYYGRTLDAMLARETGDPDLGLDLVRGAQMLFRRIADALGSVALRLAARAPQAEEKTHVINIASDAFRARAEQIKWHSFEHTRAPARSWQHSNELMRAIESLDLGTRRSAHGASCAETFSRCLLLESLNVGILDAPALELAHRWLAASAHELRLEPFFDADAHGYQIDLGRPAGPERVTPASSASDLTRYLAVTALAPRLAAARTQLYAGQLSIGVTPNRAMALHFGAFLDIAERLWSPDWRRATWREERQPAIGQSVDVVVGRDAVLRVLRSDETDAPATEVQNWALNDRSASGLGARLPLHMESNAPPGALIAFRDDVTAPWALGHIVRRIRVADDAVWVVGVRRVCQEPVAIELLADPEQPLPQSDGGAIAAVYAPINADSGRIDGLVVAPEIFAARSHFLLRTASNAFRIHANRVIDRGSDWVRFGFEVLAKK